MTFACLAASGCLLTVLVLVFAAQHLSYFVYPLFSCTVLLGVVALFLSSGLGQPNDKLARRIVLAAVVLFCGFVLASMRWRRW